jgi:hypothetical protein
MARTLRVEYPGAIYHVMNRGDRREPIFKDDAEMDRAAAIHGKLDACVELHRNDDEMKAKVSIVRTDPFTDPFQTKQ